MPVTTAWHDLHGRTTHADTTPSMKHPHETRSGSCIFCQAGGQQVGHTSRHRRHHYVNRLSGFLVRLKHSGFNT